MTFSILPFFVFFTRAWKMVVRAGNLSNCKRGCQLGERCVGNAFSQPVKDNQCYPCATGQYWWPCNFETLCYCNNITENAPRVPPAPLSGELPSELDPCQDILTEEIFTMIVQPDKQEGKQLFSYSGFCSAIGQYNTFHDEKFAGMGSETQIRGELAAFLAHTYADTRGFSVIREEHHCVSPITGSDGRVYCKPCKEEHYNKETKKCSEPYMSSEPSYKEYCDVTRQGERGCDCQNVTMSNVPVSAGGAIDTNGYILASDAYFTRGSLHLQWNYDYYGASLSLTGNPVSLCENPDLVATSSEFAWGSGIYKWMEKQQHGTTGSTAHKQVLKGNFAGTIGVLYGPLECPSSQWTSMLHVDMVQDRVAKVCQAGTALGVFLEMDKCELPGECVKCKGLKELYDLCQDEGTCPSCLDWADYQLSEAPTVTPIRIEPPSWDNWAGSHYSSRSGTYQLKKVPSVWSIVFMSSLSFVATVSFSF